MRYCLWAPECVETPLCVTVRAISTTYAVPCNRLLVCLSCLSLACSVYSSGLSFFLPLPRSILSLTLPLHTILLCLFPLLSLSLSHMLSHLLSISPTLSPSFSPSLSLSLVLRIVFVLMYLENREIIFIQSLQPLKLSLIGMIGRDMDTWILQIPILQHLLTLSNWDSPYPTWKVLSPPMLITRI